MFDGSIIVSQNEELIFTRGKNQSRESVDIMVVHQLPRNGAGGYGSQGMTQKQCDAYYMNDGTNCPGMNDMYKEFDGYKGRYDSRPRAEGYVKTEEVWPIIQSWDHWEQGFLNNMYNVNLDFMHQ